VSEPQLQARERVHREVVSYVRRSARMRPNQRRAWQQHGQDYLLEVPARETSTSIHPSARLDLPAAFGRSAPLVVEIGPGTGESLVAMAAARPEVDVLAFEVYAPAVAQLVAALAREQVSNVRIVAANAAEGLQHLVDESSVTELWTFFPDPWPKAKHHKRRLVGPDFAALAASRLVPGGRWRLATDWDDYARQMREVLDAEPRLRRESDDEGERWSERPVTRFEARGVAAGRSVTDLSYLRVPTDAGSRASLERRTR
jgi:tRNA (guanine-N7-)-methyltransferase